MNIWEAILGIVGVMFIAMMIYLVAADERADKVWMQQCTTAHGKSVDECRQILKLRP
jgi:hypothetical protein